MFANSVLVTGTNRGLGLGFIKQLADKTNHLFAGCRSPKDAEVCDFHFWLPVSLCDRCVFSKLTTIYYYTVESGNVDQVLKDIQIYLHFLLPYLPILPIF